MTHSEVEPRAGRPRLAIIGCGSSGLICLKTALAELPGWDVTCFEKSGGITGCWGNPYPGFVSTSTKYTTQFACFPEQDATVEPDGGRSRAEFFRGGEYGEYLTRFAEAFGLLPHVKLRHQVDRLDRAEGGGWLLTYRSAESADARAGASERFDAVVICTGLASEVKEIESATPRVPLTELNSPGGVVNVRNERIVVFGGGESAVDFATRLSEPELGNEVYLSLRTGIRVSPRYHPIRGVPSDFLRNRLMLSIHPTLRNWIGQRFVEARILYQERFHRWFPAAAGQDPAAQSPTEQSHLARRKEWAYKLTRAAKDELFNMFHNKSDDFLDLVAEGRITIVGPPADPGLGYFHRFDSTERLLVRPTKILPAIGYRSTLGEIGGGWLRLSDFYLGCCHATFPDLFLVGFARPVIGNIPTISEMQAAYVCGLIGGRFPRPGRVAERNAADRREIQAWFSKLDLEAVYPVEMFPYCDRLSGEMGTYPSLSRVGSLRSWWRQLLSPATTMHYHRHDPKARSYAERAPVYVPTLLISLLLALKPIDWAYRVVEWLSRRLVAR